MEWLVTMLGLRNAHAQGGVPQTSKFTLRLLYSRVLSKYKLGLRKHVAIVLYNRKTIIYLLINPKQRSYYHVDAGEDSTAPISFGTDRE